MSDKAWDKLTWFFILTIIPGGLLMAYFGERNQLGFILENTFMKFSIIIYFIVGAFCAIYSEVRKRNNSGFHPFWVTLFSLAIIGLFLALARM